MTQQGDTQYTWDDTVAALGQDFSGGEVRLADETVCYNDVRRFCEAVENDCPLHYDEAVARAHGYKGVLVPWASYHQTFNQGAIWKPGQVSRWPDPDPNADASQVTRQMPSSLAPRIPQPRTTGAIVTDLEIELFEPVCVGDRIYQKGNKLHQVNVRETRIGYGAFIVMESELYNQRDELVAKVYRGTYYFNPGETAPQS